MKPLHLDISNFMNHKKSVIPFSTFKSALVVGKTKENDAISNGVGKSTVFSAVEWALYNKVHKTTLDKVVRDGAKKCQVEYSFEIDGTSYKIIRSLTAKGTKSIYIHELIDKEWVSITQRTPTETEEKIQSILRLSHKAFTYSVLFRQADLSGLVESSGGKEENSKERSNILKEPMNLMRYSKKEKITLDLAKPLRKDVNSKESALEILGDPEKDIKESEKELEKCILQLGEKNDLIKNDLLISLEAKNANLISLKSTLSSSDADVHNKVEDQHKKVKALNRAIKELGDNHGRVTLTVDTQTSILSDRREKLLVFSSDLSAKTAEEHREIVKINSEFTKVSSDEVKGSGLLSKAEVELDFAKRSIPDSDECPSCEQSITAEYRKKFEADIQKVIKEKQTDIDFYNSALSKCRNKKKKLSKELELARKHSVEVASLQEKIDSAKESISGCEENITNAKLESKRIEERLDSNTAELQEAIKHYDNLKELAAKSDLTELNTKIFSAAREIKVYEQSIESMRTEVQSLKTREGILTDRIETRTADLDKAGTLKNELKTLRHELSIHQRVIDSFSHKGIPTFIINTCLNELQVETNTCLQELRPDLEVQFDADLNFTYRRNGVERDYHQLSHGQHVYIALAFKRGLAKVVQRQMNVDIRFLEFDEIDASLDKAGVEALSTAIKKWQDEFTILVVTHRDDLKDKFSHAILVEEGDDGSEASVVTSW